MNKISILLILTISRVKDEKIPVSRSREEALGGTEGSQLFLWDENEVTKANSSRWVAVVKQIHCFDDVIQAPWILGYFAESLKELNLWIWRMEELCEARLSKHVQAHAGHVGSEETEEIVLIMY